MEDQYGLPDLRQLMAARTHFPAAAVSQPLEPPQPFSSLHRNNLTPAPPLQQPLAQQSQHHHYDPISLATATNNTPSQHHHHFGFSTGPYGRQDMEYGNRNDGSNSGRWPRQETLTLLEIRSRLDSKFREANQKGPLWDEVSRIMLEEHGYQRSGKKCREKFENLYKYYKKTKEGKAGRQDGKNYRFFRQLEAIYGESATSHGLSAASDNHLLSNMYPTTNEASLKQTNREGVHDYKFCDSLSFSNSSHEFETSSNNSENNEGDLSVIAFMMNQSVEKNKKRVDHEREESSRRSNRRGWKEKVKGFVDNEIRKLMEKQEVWMENILKTIELREQERVTRELEWKKQEMARFDREHEIWAKEKEWIQARDNALMEALKKFIGGQRDQQPNLLSLAITKEHMGKDQEVDDEQNLSIEENAQPQHHAVTSTRSTSASVSSEWSEPETLSLIQLRTSLEQSFFEFGYSSGDGLWEVVAEKMACFGYNRTQVECKDKWETIRSYLNKKAESSKKYKDDMFH